MMSTTVLETCRGI